jgi:hypothetical protein
MSADLGRYRIEPFCGERQVFRLALPGREWRRCQAGKSPDGEFASVRRHIRNNPFPMHNPYFLPIRSRDPFAFDDTVLSALPAPGFQDRSTENVASNWDQLSVPWTWSDVDESGILYSLLESRFLGQLPDDDDVDNGTVSGTRIARGSE